VGTFGIGKNSHVNQEKDTSSRKLVLLEIKRENFMLFRISKRK